MDFVEICNVYFGKMIIKAAKSIFNSDKICRSYSGSPENLGGGVWGLSSEVPVNTFWFIMAACFNVSIKLNRVDIAIVHKKEQERCSDAFPSDLNTASEATLKTKWLHFVYGF